VFDPPIPLIEECYWTVVTEMQKASEVMLMPWDEMRGLSVEVDCKKGPNWAEMKGFSLC
jgi:hypothetical protein